MHGFIDNDMEDDVVSGAQLGGARLGAGGFASRRAALVQRQGPIQPGATPPGKHKTFITLHGILFSGSRPPST